MERDSSSIVWEFVPSRKAVPPGLRWVIKLPVQRVHLGRTSIAFEGAEVFDAYPERDKKGRHVFKERKVKQRMDPVPLDDIEQAAVYPARAGGTGGSHSSSTYYVAVDLWRRNDARTVAAFNRYGQQSVAEELALVAAIRDVVGIGWIEPPAENAFCKVDQRRIDEWRA